MLDAWGGGNGTRRGSSKQQSAVLHKARSMCSSSGTRPDVLADPACTCCSSATLS